MQGERDPQFHMIQVQAHPSRAARMSRQRAVESVGVHTRRSARTGHRIVPLAIIVGRIASLADPSRRPAAQRGHDAAAHLTYTYLDRRAIARTAAGAVGGGVRNGESQPLFSFYPPGLVLS